MKLQDINKENYRRKLNQVIVGFIITFALLAVLFGTVLIVLFSDPMIVDAVNNSTEQGQGQNNFRFNFLGVILALLSCGAILQQLKNKPFFTEIYYIWQLKQLQNKIYRRLKKIKQASLADDINALIILKFYYTSLKQLYILDDNTITMSSVNADLEKLELRIKNQDVEIELEQFQAELLQAYK